MAEQYMPTKEDDLPGPLLHEVSTFSEESTIIDLEEYRKAHERRRKLRDIGRVATDRWLEMPADNIISHVPVYIDEHVNGDITVKLMEYMEGMPSNGLASPQSGGLSGGMESTRVLVVKYIAESGMLSSGYINPRNLIFLKKDIESKNRTTNHKDVLRSLPSDLWD